MPLTLISGDNVQGDNFNIGITTATNLKAQNLNITGVGTLGVTSATNLTAQQLSVSGIATITNNLTVNGGTLFVDSVNNRVGINTLTPIQPFQVGTGSSIVVVDTQGELGIGTTNPLGLLQVGAASTQAFTVTQVGTAVSVGIGSINPFSNLDVQGTIYTNRIGIGTLGRRSSGNSGSVSNSQLYIYTESDTTTFPLVIERNTPALDNIESLIQFSLQNAGGYYSQAYFGALSSAASEGDNGRGATFIWKHRQGGSATETMRLTRSGRLGIGSTSPSVALDCTGAISAQGGNAPSGGFQLPDTSGNKQPRITNDNNNATVIRAGSATGGVIFNNFANSSTLATIDNSGRLLVGSTSAPLSSTSSLLNVTGSLRTVTTNSNAIIIQRPADVWSANDYNDLLWQGVTGGGVDRPWGRIRVQVTSASGVGGPTFMSFHTNGDAADTTERLRITAGGYVGVGHTSPHINLSVYGANANAPTAGTASGSFLIGNADKQYGILSGVSGSGWGWFQVQRVDGVGNLYDLVTQPIGGNLLVGKTSSTSNGGVLQVSNGITFPATQSACTDPNTLDDYEEGTFTPTWINGSGSTVTPSGGASGGAYTKIGRMVHIRIHTYSVSNLTTIRRIEGLPFTISGTTDYGGGGVVVGQHGASGAQSNLSIPNLTIVRDGTPNGIQFNADYSFPTSGTNIDICFWYQTT